MTLREFLGSESQNPGQRTGAHVVRLKIAGVDVWTQAGAQDPKLIEGKGIGSQFQPEQSTLLSLAVQPKTADPGLETL